MSNWLFYICIFVACLIGGFLIGSTFDLNLDHHKLKAIGQVGIMIIIVASGLYYWQANKN